MVIPIKDLGNKVLLQCPNCEKQFERYKKCFNPNANFCCCSLACKKKYAKEHHIFAGKNNPNYGNSWSKKQRKHLSKIVKERMKDPEYRYKKNQPKTEEAKKSKAAKLSQHMKKRLANSVNPFNAISASRLAKLRKQHSIRMKHINHLPEYKAKVRKTKELHGKIVPLKDLSDYKLYKRQANWIQPMYDLIDDPQQKALYEKYGTFSSIKSNMNIAGVQRDHKFSIYEAFKCKVFPEIIRHPCNCQLLQISANASKNAKSCITLKMLFSAILNYNKQWIEQEKCIQLIQKYIAGNRWSNPYSG